MYETHRYFLNWKSISCLSHCIHFCSVRFFIDILEAEKLTEAGRGIKEERSESGRTWVIPRYARVNTIKWTFEDALKGCCIFFFSLCFKLFVLTFAD